MILPPGPAGFNNMKLQPSHECIMITTGSNRKQNKKLPSMRLIVIVPMPRIVDIQGPLYFLHRAKQRHAGLRIPLIGNSSNVV